MKGIAGCGPDELYFHGKDGHIHRYDGTFAAMSSGCANRLEHMWCEEGALFAVGWYGSVLSRVRP